MRWTLLLIFFLLNNSVSAKEWRNLKEFKQRTKKQNLSPSDWLKSDRRKNTLVWQNANKYNLNNNLPQEYARIIERKDFYKWLYKELNKQGHEVVWVKMAYYISKKLCKMQSFPFSVTFGKKILQYANSGSQNVFNHVFIELSVIYNSTKVLKNTAAIQWDKDILYNEQYLWISSIYKTIDTRSLKKLQRIAKGKFFYSLVVPKKIRFKGNLSSAEARYNYALKILREYCQNRYK